MTDTRELFEAAVVARMRESGFLEVEIRVECLVRCGDGYQDELINAGWHYWNAASIAGVANEPQSKAIADVAAERKRQIEVEDFDASHDDMATRGQLATAAACYAFQAGARGRSFPNDPQPIGIWPWDRGWWKPTKDHRRNLIKAGALIIAEIERLDRAEARP